MLTFLKQAKFFIYGEGSIPRRFFAVQALIGAFICLQGTPSFAFKAPSAQDAPDTINVKGKLVELKNLKNPLRTDTANLEKHIKEGGEIYIKNCFLCHGDLLDGKGVFGESLFPPPANFKGPGSILSKPEYYSYWRVVKGGKGLPKKYGPWNSAMPAWENSLSDDEVWKVILYIFETAGERVDKNSPSSPSLEKGKTVYLKKCAFCHGETGDGKGGSAPYSSPKPRNFTKGHIKIRSTPFGKIPTDDDLFKAISKGLAGTTMPGWSHLPEVDRWSLILYLKSLSKKFAKFIKKGETHKIVNIPPMPQFTIESLASGKELFLKNCSGCHGLKGRGDGEAIHRIVNIEKDNLFPRNLSKSWKFRRGSTRQDIFATLRTGLSLTAMPQLSSKIFNDSQIIDIVHYVQTLSPAIRPEIKKTITVEKISGNLPDDPGSKIWKSVNAYYFPLTGQVIEEPKAHFPTADSLYIQAVHNGEEIAFRILWDDPTVDPILRKSDKVDESPPPPLPEELQVDPKDLAPPMEPKPQKFPDSIAMQFPLSFSGNPEKPYFLNGDENHPVNLWKWNSYPTGAVNMVAKGIDTIEALPAEQQDLYSSFDFKYGQYNLVLKRKLNKTDGGMETQFTAGQPIPVAFNIWDGTQGETGSRKAISSWFELILK